MRLFLLSIGLLLFIELKSVFGLGEIIYALNAGGESFTDTHGIRYRRDYLTVGTASDYGRMVDIKRVLESDKLLYQTERYATETFGYTIPMPAGDGDYVLWLKFCEVWFNAPNLKVFDVSLNDAIVVNSLDIFERVGRGVAHDEVIPFQIRQNKIIINGKGSPFNNEIRIEFLKSPQDNPKVNAIIVMKGTPDQVPKLPDYLVEKDDDDERSENLASGRNEEPDFDEDDEDLEERRLRREALRQQNMQEETERSRSKKAKVPTNVPPTLNVDNPYESDETSYFIPILVAIGAFIPLLFCLCRI